MLSTSDIVKLLAGALPAFHCPYYQLSVAFRAHSRVAIARFQRGQVLALGLARRQPEEVLWTHAGPDGLNDFVRPLVGHQHVGLGLDEPERPTADDLGRHVGLELTRLTDEANFPITSRWGTRQRKFLRKRGPASKSHTRP